MFASSYVTILIFSLHISLSSQGDVGDECIFKATGSPGMCKLFNECEQAINDLKHQPPIWPQNCGAFHGTQSVVCCPSTESTQSAQSTQSTQSSQSTQTTQSTQSTPVVRSVERKEGPKSTKKIREPGEISKQKCQEYAKHVFVITNWPYPVAPVNRSECGHKARTLIVGGESADRKEFPHMAAIGYELQPGDIKWACGGTIVSEQYILTAAHCLNSQHLGEVKYVIVGVTSLNDTNKRQEFEVIKRMPHPQYRSRFHYHDVGLLQLKTTIKFNPFARPACLYTTTEITSPKAIATGWGNTGYGGFPSNDLLKVTLDIFNHSECEGFYKNNRDRRLGKGIDEGQFCAGSVDAEKDTCQGDSGGPLQIYHPDSIYCMYSVIGITSFGKGCGGLAAVYTRISHYTKWIEDIVWPLQST